MSPQPTPAVTEAELDALIHANREAWDEHAEHLAQLIAADTREHAASGEPCLHVAADDAPPAAARHNPGAWLAVALAVALALTFLATTSLQ